MSFPTTHWSLVMQARSGESPASQRALNELCQAYWYPLYGLARRDGCDPEDAEDLTQGFFEHLLKRQLIGRVSPEFGKFRHFLLVSFRNYRISQAERNRAQKRGGAFKFVPIDPVMAERKLAAEHARASVEESFDLAWAREVLAQAFQRVELHYSADGKLELFAEIKVFLQGAAQTSYAALSARLGKSEAALKMDVSRLRKMFAEMFRSAVAQTVENPAEVEDEVRYLFALLAKG